MFVEWGLSLLVSRRERQARLDFGLRENLRADEKLTAFVELESATSAYGRIVLTSSQAF
jgi:hypothetical protein